jgi:hypothetical protein
LFGVTTTLVRPFDSWHIRYPPSFLKVKEKGRAREAFLVSRYLEK